jgi:hypothetical protein
VGVLLSVVKFIGPPGSIPLLLLSLAGGGLVLRRAPRWRRVAHAWLALVTMAYIALAVPLIAHAITGRLPAVSSADPRDLGPLDTIVVFDGDNRVGRATIAARLARTSPQARIVVLGEKWLVRRLIALGVLEARFSRDEGPPTTKAQMEWMTEHASSLGPRTAIIVSRLQLPRVVAIAHSRGQSMTFVASPVDSEPPTGGLWVMVPSYASLRMSRDALYELAALAYYDWRGYTWQTH